MRQGTHVPCQLADLPLWLTAIGRGSRKCDSRPRHEGSDVDVGISDTIPVDLHDVVHEAVMAGYAAALSDLEEGKLGDEVRERSEIIE